MDKLIDIFQGILPSTTDSELAAVLAELSLLDMKLDSRQVQQGDAFVALIGGQLDGRQFIHSAIEAGAVLVLSHAVEVEQHGQLTWLNNVAIISIYELDQKLSLLAKRFYQNKLKVKSAMQVVGVTGTNGKSTVTYLMASWAQLCGAKAAVMGTLGNGLISQVLSTAINTTGDAITIAKSLAEFEACGTHLVAMEVSSHGLHQYRVAGVEFTQAVFTNLSRDHLDYHRDMQEYQDVKQMLFLMPCVQSRIINSDDPVGQSWLNQHSDAISYGLQPVSHQYQQMLASDIEYSHSGVRFSVHWAGMQYSLSAPLLGEFNVHNILAALLGLLQLGYPLELLLQSAEKLKPVPGRMECVRADNKATMVVDYAHTPDALQKALAATRIHCQGKLFVVFGCGGERDRGKRPLMAQIAERMADVIFITDDNPRNEDPKDIVRDMLAGLENEHSVRVIHDRKQAIEQAYLQAQAQDMILIAGKGHEDYQLQQGKKTYFSDQALAQALQNGEGI